MRSVLARHKQLWAEAEDLLGEIQGRERAELLAHLASASTSARQGRYVAEALEIERTLDDIYEQLSVIEYLPDTPAVIQRVLELLKAAQHTKAWDTFCTKLAARVPLADLEASIRFGSGGRLEWGRVCLIRRLAKAERVDAVLSLIHEDVAYIGQCIEAAAAILPASKLNEMLDLDPHNLGVTERMAALGEVEAAMARAFSMPPGSERFRAVARCARGSRFGYFQHALENVVDDLHLVSSIDQLWACLQEGAPQLARLPEPARLTALMKILSLLGTRVRLQAIPGLYLLAPIIDAVAGRQGIKDVFQAVANAASWWPAYPRGNEFRRSSDAERGIEGAAED